MVLYCSQAVFPACGMDACQKSATFVCHGRLACYGQVAPTTFVSSVGEEIQGSSRRRQFVYYVVSFTSPPLADSLMQSAEPAGNRMHCSCMPVKIKAERPWYFKISCMK